MNKRLEQNENAVGRRLTAWFPEGLHGLSLKERINRFNEYLKRRAIESEIWVRKIEIDPGIWMQGDEAVLAEVREQLIGLFDRLDFRPDQLPPAPEDQLPTPDV